MQNDWKHRRRMHLATRTVPFLAVASGDVAVDLNGRYHPLLPRESAMDGELLIACPDARWSVAELEGAIDRRYESAVRRHLKVGA